MKQKMRNLKLALALGILAAVAIYGVALAAGTPNWWDNPDGYTSWRQKIGEGTAENTGATAQDILVTMDIDNTQIPDNHKDVWLQLEWSQVAGTGNLRTDRVAIQWTNDPCPANPQDPFPNPLGFGLMTYEGPMANGPEWGYDNGDEFSFSIDVQPQCERIVFSFSLDPNSEIDYRAEAQTLCFKPTAITLQTLNADPLVSSIWKAALIIGLIILAVGVTVVARRRTKIRKSSEV